MANINKNQSGSEQSRDKQTSQNVSGGMSVPSASPVPEQSNSQNQSPQQPASTPENAVVDGGVSQRKAKDAGIRNAALSRSVDSALSSMRPASSAASKARSLAENVVDEEKSEASGIRPGIERHVATAADGSQTSVEVDEAGEIVSETPIVRQQAAKEAKKVTAPKKNPTTTQQPSSRPRPSDVMPERKKVATKGQKTPGSTQQTSATYTQRKPENKKPRRDKRDSARQVSEAKREKYDQAVAVEGGQQPAPVGGRRIAKGDYTKREPESRLTDRERIEATWMPYVRSRKAMKRDFPKWKRKADSYRTERQYSDEISIGGLRENPDPSLDDYHIKKKDTRKQDRLVDRVAREFAVGYFHVQGERISEDNVVTYSKYVEDRLVKLEKYFNIPPSKRRTIFRLVRMYCSLSTDRNGKMMKMDAGEFTMNEDDFVHACDCIYESCVKYGHPFAMVDTNFFIGGTRVWPVGLIPRSLARELCGPGSNLKRNGSGKKQTPASLVQDAQDYWNNILYPMMKETLAQEENPAQRIVIEDIIRGLGTLDGIGMDRLSERYGVSTTLDYKLSEFENETLEYAKAMHGTSDAIKVQREQEMLRNRAARRLDKRRNRARKAKNTEGMNELVKSSRENAFVGGLSFLTSLMKINGVILNPALIVATAAEHGMGNLVNSITLSAMNAGASSEFNLSEWQVEMAKSDEMIESVEAAKILMDVGGPDALLGFSKIAREKGWELNCDMAVKYCKEYVVREGHPFFNEATRKLNQITKKLMVGDYPFKRSDAMLFMRSYLTNMMLNFENKENYKEGEGMPIRPAYTAKEVESMQRASGSLGYWLAEVMGTEEGINAFIMMRADNIGQVTPLGYVTKRFLQEHGVTNFAVTAFIDTYAEYGLNFIQSYIPFSKTISYMITKGYVKSVDVKKFQDARTRHEVSDIQMSQLGGNLMNMDVFWDEGMKLNMIYDIARLGQMGVIAMFIATICHLLQFEPPQKEEDLFNVSMWRIHGKEIELAWWMNDLVLMGAPMGFAIAAYWRTGDLGLSTNLFFDGCKDMLDGNALLDAANMIVEGRETLVEWNRMIEDPSYDGPKDWWSYALIEMKMMGANAVGKLVPSMANTFHRDTIWMGTDERMRDFGKIYDKSSEWAIENGVTKNVGYEEYRDRKEAYGNIVYAGILTLLRNHGDPESTGYFWWDMPVATMQDQQALKWCSRYMMDFNNIPEGYDDASYKWEMGERVVNDIKSFGSINEALKQGYVITNDAREAAMDYCFSNVRALKTEYAARLQSGELDNYVDRKPVETSYYERMQEYYDIVYDWLKNSSIPEWSEGYEKLLTDTEVSYVFSDTGKPAPSWMALFPGVEPAYKPKGNHPTSLAPFTVVDERDRGYNAETIPYWYQEGSSGTDLDALFESNEGVEITLGRDSGKQLNDVLFGKEPSGVYTNLDEPTIGYRSYVPKDNELSKNIIDFDEENATGGELGDLGKFNQTVEDILNGKKTNNSNYPTYWPRSTYGSNAGSYSPRIYSNPRSISADKAASMYTKQPYSASQNYLRPGFSTKGSREAYKRQDI